MTLNVDANGRWIDPLRVESFIQELSQYGAHGETGVARLVYSPEWVAAQDQVAAWMEESGLRVERDAVGNVWGYLDGGDREQPIVATGSHIDSQNPGGRFDGALGVVAGILALAALRERLVLTEPPARLAELGAALCRAVRRRRHACKQWGHR